MFYLINIFCLRSYLIYYGAFIQTWIFEICSKLTIATQGRCQWRHCDVFIVVVLVFLHLTLSKQLSFGVYVTFNKVIIILRSRIFEKTSDSTFWALDNDGSSGKNETLL